MEEWIGVCEICAYKACVLASNEKDAIANSIEVHKNAKEKHCKGLFVAAFRKSELQRQRAVA